MEEGRVETVVWTPDPSGRAREGSGVQTIETEEGRRGGSGHEQEPSPKPVTVIQLQIMLKEHGHSTKSNFGYVQLVVIKRCFMYYVPVVIITITC